jgi:hypothetical protein
LRRCKLRNARRLRLFRFVSFPLSNSSGISRPGPRISAHNLNADNCTQPCKTQNARS